MNNLSTKLLVWSRSFHRILVIPAFVLTIVMSISGLLLKSELGNFDSVNYGLVREMHNKLSVIFTVLLLLMSITGTLLYILPLIRMRKINAQQKLN